MFVRNRSLTLEASLEASLEAALEGVKDRVLRAVPTHPGDCYGRIMRRGEGGGGGAALLEVRMKLGLLRPELRRRLRVHAFHHCAQRRPRLLLRRHERREDLRPRILKGKKRRVRLVRSEGRGVSD